MTSRLLTSLGLALLGSGLAFAQTTAFTYQGRLTQNGSPMNDPSVAMTFQLYDTAAGSNPVGGSIAHIVAVQDGLFTALLDFGPVPNAFDGENRWLEITVEGVPLIPRQPLTPTPFALFAYTADAVPDGSIGTDQIADGSITAEKIAPSGLPCYCPPGWLLSGNTGTNPAVNFLGTTDNQPLVIRANNRPAMRYTYREDIAVTNFEFRSMNVLGGSDINGISSTVMGATIAGGQLNSASGTYSTIGGGYANQAAGDQTTVAGGAFNTTNGVAATVGCGIDNLANGDYATVPGGYFNVASGQYSLAAGQQAQALHDGAFVWADSQAATFVSTGNDQFLIRAQGNVGINTNTPAYALDVNGLVSGTGAYVNSSDARYKTDVQDLDQALETIIRLRGVSFDWDRQAWARKNFPEGRQVGFIAQDVETVLPEVVTTDAEGYKSIAYASVVPVLVEAIKRQQKQIEVLQAECEALKAGAEEMRRIREELARLGVRPGAGR
jgi:hypothetical protein